MNALQMTVSKAFDLNALQLVVAWYFFISVVLGTMAGLILRIRGE